MATSNPSYKVSDIISDVESSLGSPGIDANTYCPWVSDAYQQVWEALAGVGQKVKENLFGANGTIPLVQSTLETSISGSIPRFSDFIKVEVQYGATGDLRNPAEKLPSVANWGNLANVSTQYRAKTSPVYYQSGDSIGVIPVAPESGAQAFVRFVQRPQQLTVSTDIIDLPYRFIFPIKTFVKARAIENAFQDFVTAMKLDQKFQADIERACVAADSEHNENDGTSAIQESSSSLLYDNPQGGTW